jgi:hypothetical protein
MMNSTNHQYHMDNGGYGMNVPFNNWASLATAMITQRQEWRFRLLPNFVRR